MNEKNDVLKIVKEDILRILKENKETPYYLLKKEIKVSDDFLSQGIKELKKEGLLQTKKSSFSLTAKGEKEAYEILKKHQVIENFFLMIRDKKQAHQAAHILEHLISQEVINNLKKIATFKEKGIYLTDFPVKKEGLITDLVVSDNKLFERLLSMGIFPGEKMKIINRTPVGFILKIGNKKFALDKDIAQGIKILK